MKAHAPVGTVIRELRKENGWKQVELATRVGIGQTNFSRFERGKQNLDAENLKAVAHAFGLSVAQLYARAGAEEPKFVNQYFQRRKPRF